MPASAIGYAHWLTETRRLDSATVAAYASDIARLGDGLGDDGDDALLVPMAQRATATGGVSSQLRRLTALHHYAAYLRERLGVAAAAPAPMRRPTVAARCPAVLSKDDVALLFHEATGYPADTALLALLYYGGLRVSEAVALPYAAMRQEGAGALSLRIMGKGSKERWVPLPEPAVRALDAWLRFSGSGAYVFPDPERPGAHISRFSAYRTIRALARRALGRDVHPHTLRHSFASHMLEAGVNLRCIQELLGHARLSTTEIYTRVTPGQKQAAVDALAGLDQDPELA